MTGGQVSASSYADYSGGVNEAVAGESILEVNYKLRLSDLLLSDLTIKR